MKKTIAYVDGFNLYYGIIDKRNPMPSGTLPFTEEKPWGNLLWCNLDTLIRSFHFPNTNLQRIKFFEAPSYKPESLPRQQAYINALMSLPTMTNDSFFGGDYKKRVAYCEHCRGTNSYFTEKGTDVQIAVELISDVLLEHCDSAIVISGDNDLLPVYRKIKAFKPDLPLYLVFPPNRKSSEARQIVGQAFTRQLKYERLLGNQFPDEVVNGEFVIRKPNEYLQTKKV